MISISWLLTLIFRYCHFVFSTHLIFINFLMILKHFLTNNLHSNIVELNKYFIHLSFLYGVFIYCWMCKYAHIFILMNLFFCHFIRMFCNFFIFHSIHYYLIFLSKRIKNKNYSFFSNRRNSTMWSYTCHSSLHILIKKSRHFYFSIFLIILNIIKIICN